MNRRFGRNKILGGVFVLFIAVVMILSTANGIADTSKDTKSLNNGKVGSGIGARDDLPFVEGFEECIMPPTGWTTQTSNPDCTWEITEEIVHSGTCAAFVPFCGTQAQDEWLISPYIALDGAYVEVKLDFWCNSSLKYTYGTVKVYVSTDDNFMESEVIWNMVADEKDWDELLWRNKVLYLNDSIGETVRIAWRYLAELRLQQFALDDILIYGSGGPPYPKIGDITGGFSQVCAEIQNDGYSNADYINWSIKMISPILPPWCREWNGTIQNLPSGESEIVCTDGFIFGFALVDIEVTAIETRYEYSDTKTVKGFVFLCFIFVIDS